MERGLRIDVDGTYTFVDLPSDSDTDRLAALQDAVGGWVEAIPLARGVTLWCDEDGHARDLALNTPIQVVVQLLLGDTTPPISGPMLGPIVVTGPITRGRVPGIDDEAAERITAALDAITRESRARAEHD